jgi:glycosyltransferase involved in cell wall biosynthesis
MRPIVEYIKRPKYLPRDIVRFFSQGLGDQTYNQIVQGWQELWLIPKVYFLAIQAGKRSLKQEARKIDVGLGPEPLINNIYHKRALEKYGYTAETFVYTDNFIAKNYDINLADKKGWTNLDKALYFFEHAISNYTALFIYFNGGCLFNTVLLKLFEPHLYKLANLKVLVMPFGSDVQVMIHSKNPYFKHTLAMDYPIQNRMHKQVSQNIDRWSHNADWVFSGCEWVDYMYHWNTLQLAHFSIDQEHWKPTGSYNPAPDAPFRILHAPNHKTIKGTPHLLKAIEALQEEGLNIELVLLRGVPNTEIQQAIENVDLVADQFVIGWYAMFALEAMSLEKPVLCYLREDLIDLYTKAGLVEPGEIPLINTDVLHIKQTIRWAYENRDQLKEIGRRGREYVRQHHSIEAIGKDFDHALKSLGLSPSQEPAETVKALLVGESSTEATSPVLETSTSPV